MQIEEQIASIEYPKRVDVADAIMQQVAALQLQGAEPVQQSAWHRWGRYAAMPAAVMAFVVAIQLTYKSHQQSLSETSEMLALLYDNSQYITQQPSYVEDIDYLGLLADDE